ncbi:MAG: nuclear transport factor 2 family protein [Candidatus Binatia bacterium]
MTNARYLPLAALLLGAAACTSSVPPPAWDDGPPTEPGTLEQTQRAVDLFSSRFAVIGPQLAENVGDLYSADTRFRDPITEVHGLAALQKYLAHFGEVSSGARFRITDTVVQPGDAVVFWTMVMPGDGDTPGRTIQGLSHLKVRDRIYEERDYFDMGDAVYDHIPVLNWFTGLVKSRLAPPQE